jgi:hypothetical protein
MSAPVAQEGRAGERESGEAGIFSLLILHLHLSLVASGAVFTFFK